MDTTGHCHIRSGVFVPQILDGGTDITLSLSWFPLIDVCVCSGAVWLREEESCQMGPWRHQCGLPCDPPLQSPGGHALRHPVWTHFRMRRS